MFLQGILIRFKLRQSKLLAASLYLATSVRQSNCKVLARGYRFPFFIPLSFAIALHIKRRSMDKLFGNILLASGAGICLRNCVFASLGLVRPIESLYSYIAPRKTGYFPSSHVHSLHSLHSRKSYPNLPYKITKIIG